MHDFRVKEYNEIFGASLPEQLDTRAHTASEDSSSAIGISQPNHSGSTVDITSIPAHSGDIELNRDGNPILISDPPVIRFGDEWGQAPLGQPGQQLIGQPGQWQFGHIPPQQPIQYPGLGESFEYRHPDAKKEWKEDEVIIFLEAMGLVSEKTMKKIKDALKPNVPIMHNNRIDDLILDIEE